MAVDQADIEGEAEAAYRAAGLELDEGVTPIWLAKRLLGPDAVVGVASLMQPGGGCLVRVHGQPRIYYRARLPPALRDFVIGHELAHALLGERVGDEAEAACDAFAAAVIAPRRAYLAALRAYGVRFTKLARAFATTESLVALRLGEVTGEPVALLAPHSLRVRGSECAWPSEPELRSVLPRSGPGLARARLRDDPRRTAIRQR